LDKFLFLLLLFFFFSKDQNIPYFINLNSYFILTLFYFILFSILCYFNFILVFVFIKKNIQMEFREFPEIPLCCVSFFCKVISTILNNKFPFHFSNHAASFLVYGNNRKPFKDRIPAVFLSKLSVFFSLFIISFDSLFSLVADNTFTEAICFKAAQYSLIPSTLVSLSLAGLSCPVIPHTCEHRCSTLRASPLSLCLHFPSCLPLKSTCPPSHTLSCFFWCLQMYW
jgi:hypothetical protein